MTSAMQVKEALENWFRDKNSTDLTYMAAFSPDGYGFEKGQRYRDDLLRVILAALRAPSPAVLDPVTVEACATVAESLQRFDPDATKNYAKAIRALIGQPSGNGEACASKALSSTNQTGEE